MMLHISNNYYPISPISPINVCKNIAEPKYRCLPIPVTDDYSKMNVKSLIKLNENTNLYDDMVGWTSGMNSVNQLKLYTSMNAIVFEKSAKQSKIYNYGHMKCSLMIYYLCQDDDFFNWYKNHNTDDIHTGC